VNSTGWVQNLNADRIDGLDSSAFAKVGNVDAQWLDGFDSSSFTRSLTGVQVNHTDWLPVGGNITYVTFGWPLEWSVEWTVIPAASAAQLALSVEVQRGSSQYYTLSYILRVQNTGAYGTPFKLRYLAIYNPAAPSSVSSRSSAGQGSSNPQIAKEQDILDRIKVKRLP